MGSGLLAVTRAVSDDEPCFELAEVNKASTNRRHIHSGKPLRRVQVIRVIRNDRVYTQEKDLGPADAFQTDPFAFQGAVPLGNGRWDVLETVGRLRAAADDFRAKYDRPHERGEKPDFVHGFEEIAERRRRALRGR